MRTPLLLTLALTGLAAAQTATPSAPASSTAQPATAQSTTAQASPVKLTASTQLVKVVTENGASREVLSPATSAVPGDVLQFSQHLENVSANSLRGVALTQNVSPATAYQSAKCSVPGVTTTYSVDGKTYGATLKKTVTVQVNGADVRREVDVPPAEYAFVKWTLPVVQAGAAVDCSIRVQVK